MMHGLPLAILIFAAILTLLAFWRLVLMIVVAAALTVLTLGLIDVITWFGALR